MLSGNIQISLNTNLFYKRSFDKPMSLREFDPPGNRRILLVTVIAYYCSELSSLSQGRLKTSAVNRKKIGKNIRQLQISQKYFL